MNIYKKIITLSVLLLSLNITAAKKKEKEIDDSVVRSTQHQLAQQVSTLGQRLTTSETHVAGLQKTSFSLLTMLMNGPVDRAIVFDSDVTVDTGSVFTVVTPDAFAVHTKDAMPVILSATSFAGINLALHTNLFLSGNTLPSSSDTHTIINGTLTIKECLNLTIEGNLVVNGAIIIENGATLTVQGTATFDGQCLNTFVNAGTITATGQITVKNYASDADSGKAVDNSGTITVITNTDSNFMIAMHHNKATGEDGVAVDNSGQICTGAGNIVMHSNHSTGVNSVAVNNSGLSAAIKTTSGSITFEHNFGVQQTVHNANSAQISTMGKGKILIQNNVSHEGVAVCNDGEASISTEDGDICIQLNDGAFGAVVNMDAAKIESSSVGAIFIIDNTSKLAIAFLNTGSGSDVFVDDGTIVMQGNRGATAGVCNMDSAKIAAETMGSIWFINNHATGAAGVLNSGSAAIESLTAGSIYFEQNSGETVGVLSDDNATITAQHHLIFTNNHGRTNAGIVNQDGSVMSATGAESIIKFVHNTGRYYGVLNLTASGSFDTEIRTTSGPASSSNTTKIQFIGNYGSICDTKCQTTGGSGNANIIAGAASGTTGHGMICYDDQRDISAFGLVHIHPMTTVCTEIYV